jgi:hypothetical protein
MLKAFGNPRSTRLLSWNGLVNYPKRIDKKYRCNQDARNNR